MALSRKPGSNRLVTRRRDGSSRRVRLLLLLLFHRKCSRRRWGYNFRWPASQGGGVVVNEDGHHIGVTSFGSLDQHGGVILEFVVGIGLVLE